jgi:hypothetical protein
MVGRPRVSPPPSWSCSDRYPRVVVASVLLVNAHTWGLNSVRLAVEPPLSVRDSDSMAARSSPLPSSSPTIFEREFHLGHREKSVGLTCRRGIIQGATPMTFAFVGGLSISMGKPPRRPHQPL